MTSPQWHRQVVCRPHEQETVRSSVRSGRRACPRGHRVGARTNLPTAATPPSCRRRQPRRAQNAREWLENRAPASTGIGPPPKQDDGPTKPTSRDRASNARRSGGGQRVAAESAEVEHHAGFVADRPGVMTRWYVEDGAGADLRDTAVLHAHFHPPR
jgi:hypothetical protein